MVNGVFIETFGRRSRWKGDGARDLVVRVMDDATYEDGATMQEEIPRDQKFVLGEEAAYFPNDLEEFECLKGTMSLDVWENVLSEEERETLRKLLPEGIDEGIGGFFEMVLRGEENVNFGIPLRELWHRLVEGEMDEEVASWREGTLFLKKTEYYYSLRDYHDRLIKKLESLRDQFGKPTNRRNVRSSASKAQETSAKGTAQEPTKSTEPSKTSEKRGDMPPRKRKRGENVVPSKKGSRVLRAISEAMVDLLERGVEATEANLVECIISKAPIAVTATIVDIHGVVSEAMKFLENPPSLKEWLGNEPAPIVERTGDRWVWVGPTWGETIMDAAGKPTTATRKLEPALEASFAKAMRSRGYIVKPDESMVASIAKIKASEKSASEQVGQHEGTGRKVAPDGLLLPEQTTNESILSESDASLVGIKSLSEGRPTDISLDLNSNVGTGALGNESQFEAI